MKLSIEHYVSTNNQKEAEALLSKYGVPRANNMPDLIKKIHYVVRKHKELAINDLASIDTPYRRLILSTVKPSEIAKTIEKIEEKSNACGCSGADGEHSNCSGCGGTCGMNSSVDGKTEKPVPVPAPVEVKTEPKEKSSTREIIVAPTEKSMDKYMPLVALGVFGIVAIIIAKS